MLQIRIPSQLCPMIQSLKQFKLSDTIIQVLFSSIFISYPETEIHFSYHFYSFLSFLPKIQLIQTQALSKYLCKHQTQATRNCDYSFQFFDPLNKIIIIVINLMLSVTTPLQIRNNPSNKSSSKQQWSFSKDSRFKKPYSNCYQSSYNQRSCLSERKTSFGYGNRSKFFDGQKDVPEGGIYEKTSDFDTKKKNKGFSFTANRENLIFSHYAKNVQNTPHPAAYDQDSDQVKKKKYYSMRPKTAYPKNYFIPSEAEKERMKIDPGPGKYQTIDVLGKSYHTKSTNHHAQPFCHDKRFYQEKLTPGPMDYTNKTIDADGIYLLSNMKGSGRRTFLNGKRKFKLDATDGNPGPGNYRLPSDFGHYEQNLRPSTARG